jgi:aryl-alcohol dehydrogenase-like predicted oxidoreductase
MTTSLPASQLMVPKRRLGIDGLEVSEIGLGFMPMSEFYGPADEKACEQAVRRAVELGVTFIDTASAYGSESYGESANEDLLGRALRGRRDEVVLATKFGVRRVGGNRIADNSAAHIRDSIDASLRRLGTEYVDLYYMHRRDPLVPIEETVGVMSELVTAGKVRYLGLSEVAGDTLRKACKVHQISAVQCEYSLMSRHIEDDLLEVARAWGVGLVAYAPLGRALLTNEWSRVRVDDPRDVRFTIPRFRQSNLRNNLDLVDQVKPLAAELECSLAQLALAWLLRKGEDIVPIPGTRRISHLEENAGACAVRDRLTAQHMEELETVFQPKAVAGERNSPEAMTFMSLEP